MSENLLNPPMPSMTMPNTNMPINNSYTKIPSCNLKICSLNSRSLSKLSNPEISSSFIRYLRSLDYDVFCFQESHASGDDVQSTLNMKLQAHSSIWTEHCGVVSLNPSISIVPILVTIDQRSIVCLVTHANNSFDPITLVNIYAPAQIRPRETFYANMLNLPMFRALQDSPAINDSMMIVGDFNYHAIMYDSDSSHGIADSNMSGNLRAQSSQFQWHCLLTSMFHDLMYANDQEQNLPTFRRGSSMSTIDYMYASPSLLVPLRRASSEFISSQWTDHALLLAHFQFECSDQGSGLWRANPSLSSNSYFTAALTTALDNFHQFDSTTLSLSTVQEQWDKVKTIVRNVAQTVGRRKAEWQKRVLKRLQRKRNKILRCYKSTGVLNPRLHVIENFIGMIQKEISENMALRAGKHWREKGETSAGYLKRTIETRNVKRNMPPLLHPTTQTLCVTPNDMQNAVTSFYSSLYTPDPIDEESTQDLTSLILPQDQLPSSASITLLRPFTVEELIEGASRSPRKSSPGVDGLPYEILVLLFQHPRTSSLASSVYSDALLNGIFPTSWNSTCMTLLPKKGDLSNLKNWRPISLINTDAKVFTRLLNARLMPYFTKCISSSQLGFMPGRFIADHGLTVNSIKMIAHHHRSSSIGLLLDQEKAYDRIHPIYLRHVLNAFNVPASISHCIISLFFSTGIQVNVNGHITSTPIPQLRGLRQGDPLSPLLFNIAFDPFVRSICQNGAFKGFHLPTEIVSPPPSSDDVLDDLATLFENTHITSSVDDHDVNLSRNLSLPADNRVAILAYADDTLVFLRD